MKTKTWTDEEFIAAVVQSPSVAQVLGKLGLVPAGGNYQTFWDTSKRLNLDLSHMKGQAWNKGRTVGPKRPLSNYLENKFRIKSYKLKERLIREGHKERCCERCHRKTWNKKPVPIELHHINGEHLDNTLSNLEILCPNCHAQTPTYRGKNHGCVR